MKYLAWAILFFLVGCSTYQTKMAGPRNLIKEGRFTEALEQLKPLAEKDDRDQLVYLLDYATALQMSGQHKESVQAFLKADKIAEIVDITLYPKSP